MSANPDRSRLILVRGRRCGHVAVAEQDVNDPVCPDRDPFRADPVGFFQGAPEVALSYSRCDGHRVSVPFGPKGRQRGRNLDNRVAKHVTRCDGSRRCATQRWWVLRRPGPIWRWARRKSRGGARACAQGVAASGVGLERLPPKADASSVAAAVVDRPQYGSSGSRKPRLHCRRLPAAPLGRGETPPSAWGAQ